MEVSLGNLFSVVPPLLQTALIIIREWETRLRERRETEKEKRLDPGTESQPPIR